MLALTLGLTGCGVFFPEGGGGATEPVPEAKPKGCLAPAPQTIAPNGYYVNGNTVCTADGKSHLFHGVARPSLEWASAGEHVTEADFQLMASWKANVVRIALNQDFWLSTSPSR